MSGDTVLGLLLLVVALTVLSIAAAAEAGVVFLSRVRVRAFATKGVAGADSLASYIQERQSLLATLMIARTVAVVLGIAMGTFLVLRGTGHTWVALTATMAGAVLALALLEAVPRLVVARSPERWGLRLVPVMSLFRLMFGVPARFLIMTADKVLPIRPGPDAGDREEDEELLRIVELREGNGSAQNGELTMIKRIAQMVDTAAREIMVPRIDIVAVENDAPIDEVLRIIIDRGFTRVPVYEETVDNIVGIVHAKDLLQALAEGRRPSSPKELAREAYFVPDGKHVDELLAEMRENRVHLAIVVDEYGGTAGLVTIEDVLEEIVGEIQDEYDREEAAMHLVNENEAIVDAKVSLDDLNELLDLDIESEDFDTVGGFVYHELGRMPSPGDEVRAGGLTLRVLSVLGRRIKKVRVSKLPEVAAPPAS
jgi:CBS domain containing-hemolysin-like protein